MIECHILGVGVMAPGLTDWDAACSVLAGETPYRPEQLPPLNPVLLPANERRRATATIRLALEVASQAAKDADIDPSTTATVFTSSGGDSHVIHAICQELSHPSPSLSPTAFHNSVHNAPAGYWSIATKSVAPYTCLSASDGSLGMGLIEAATQLQDGSGPILLVGYEIPTPFPLSEQYPAHHPFAYALVLDSSCASGCKGQIRMATDSTAPPSGLNEPALEALRLDNAAARVLSLLKLMASQDKGQVILPLHQEQRLRLQYTPC